jgi:hypothetical protein
LLFAASRNQQQLDPYIAELNRKVLRVAFSNTMTAGALLFRDFRATASDALPFVEIGNGVSITGVTWARRQRHETTVFGYEPFTATTCSTRTYQFGYNHGLHGTT